MQLRHLATIQPATVPDSGGPSAAMVRVTAISWSANNRKMAAVSTDRIIHLFDEGGQRRDKFNTKPADPKGPKNYIVRAIAWSPDSSKLAVAQSDNIVFVYKLGVEWGERKSICNKFLQSSSITSLSWPVERPNEVVFGLAEGRVRVGQLRSNKAATLYTTDSYVVSLAAQPSGNGVVSGHHDGSIHIFSFADGRNQRLCTHNNGVAPTALAWGEAICAAGNDCKAVFYDDRGGVQQVFDYSQDEDAKEFTVARFNPSGETVVLGSFDRFVVINYNARRNMWEEVGVKKIQNFYTVTAMAWKADGSRLAVGSLCGAIEAYDACIRRYTYQGKFEFTYVSTSQVIVKRLGGTGTRIMVKSRFNLEISKINIYQERFVVAHTPETLLMGDMEICKLSEVAWAGSGQEKYFFDNPAVGMVFNAGELSLVEYGCNEVLGSCRTEHMNPHFISVRTNEARGEAKGNKKIAYLQDLQTIRILDLDSGITVATIEHDSKVDWLELNTQATTLLFRDKKRQLHLYDLENQVRSTLLTYCSYVQWVPDSDVVVAQNRNNLCVWYSVAHPERVTIIQIKGDVEDIERTADGRTEVVVDEGISTVSYALDQALIEFGTAIERHDYDRALLSLEQLDLTPETEAMWQTLSEAAVSVRPPQLLIAERCYAALGDICRTRYIHKVNTIAAYAKETVGGDGTQHFMVRAKLAAVEKNFKSAENILVDQGQIDEALEMYQEMHKWDEAIFVAESKNHPSAAELRLNYFTWLTSSGQEDKAGELKEKEGDYLTAVQLYLKGGLAGKAAALVTKTDVQFAPDILEKIASSLVRSQLYEKAGMFLEELEQSERAMEAYCKGHAYRRAVSLARRDYPQHVVQLEEDWGDYLVSHKQPDMAIDHFIEAGQTTKAIEAAIAARQWGRAIQTITDYTPDEQTTATYFKRIARHFEEVRSYKEAEKYYIRAGGPQEAVDMYTRASKWDDAHKVAMTYMSQADVATLNISQAQRLEGQQRYKDAEKLYLLVNEPDYAISMYKKNRQFDHMIRLVTTYRKDLLTDTHLHLAEQLEHEGNYREAERHYTEARDWKLAVRMFQHKEMWEDAIRVAKLHGGVSASKQVAFSWAVSLGGEAGAKLLQKFGLIDQAIDYAIESSSFEHGFVFARAGAKHKLPEVHLKYAMFLEDEGRFKDAEAEFIKAEKPKEAIEMWLHSQDYGNAMRVADNHDPASVSDVLVAQARHFWDRNEHQRAEALYLRAKKPDLLLGVYKDSLMWQDAIRLAKEYLPHKLGEVQMEFARFTSGGGTAEHGDLLSNGRMWEQQKEYSAAIDAYLKITTANTQDPDYLEEAWENAVRLAMDYVRERIPEVVSTVSGRLVSIKRYDQAAELYQGIGQHKEAAGVYIRAAMWEKARDVYRKYAPELEQYVESQYVAHLKGGGNADALISAGHSEGLDAGLDMLADRGEWDRIYTTCQDQQRQDQLERYQAMHLQSLVADSKCADALDVLVKYGAPAVESHFPLYKRIATRVVSFSEAETVVKLKDLLAMLLPAIRESSADASRTKEFERLALIADLSALRTSLKAKGMPEYAAKVAISVLRYCADVPADKCFYDAAMECKLMGWHNMAFVFFNRYLDLSEAIDDGETSSRHLDHSDLRGSDVPQDFPLPSEQFLDEDKREEVRDWVLQLSMETQVAQNLSAVELDFIKQNLAIDDTAAYWRALQSQYMAPAGPPAPAQLS